MMRAWVILSVGAAIGCGAETSGGQLTAQCFDERVDGAGCVDAAALLGDDVLGDWLRRDWDGFQPDPLEIASGLGAGIDCPSDNTYFAEERQTRFEGQSVLSETVLPRAVLSSCNEVSPSVFVVLTSPQDAQTEPDPVALNATTEIMARDRTTGLFNFYAVERSVTGFELRRWVEEPSGLIRVFEADSSRSETSSVDAEGGCFYCHANGAPMLLEADGTSTAWLPPSLPSERDYRGITAQLHAAAAPFDSLVEEVRRSTKTHVDGAEAGGYLKRALEGKLGGGTSRLLQSLFCPTEYQVVSPPVGRVPLSYFADPILLGLPADTTLEAPNAALRWAPVRAQADQDVESALGDAGVLSDSVLFAVRLLRPDRDLDRRRCSVYWQALADVPADPFDVDDYLRRILSDEWRARSHSDARAVALALLNDAPNAQAELDAYRSALLEQARTSAAAASASALENGARSRTAWMFERFIPPFALNPLFYEHWLE